MQSDAIVLLFWIYIGLKERRWILTIPRLSPIHSGTLQESGAVRHFCGRYCNVPAIAHPLKATCSRCSLLLTASNSRRDLALLQQFHRKTALAPSPTARHLTSGHQPWSRSPRIHIKDLNRL